MIDWTWLSYKVVCVCVCVNIWLIKSKSFCFRGIFWCNKLRTTWTILYVVNLHHKMHQLNWMPRTELYAIRYVSIESAVRRTTIFDQIHSIFYNTSTNNGWYWLTRDSTLLFARSLVTYYEHWRLSIMFNYKKN